MNQFYKNYGYAYDSALKARDALAWYWVQGGKEAAQNAYVAPGQIVAFWESNEQIIYLKYTDQLGRPTILKLRYTIDNEEESTQTSDYITKEEFASLLKSVEELQKSLKEVKLNESTLSNADAKLSSI